MTKRFATSGNPLGHKPPLQRRARWEASSDLAAPATDRFPVQLAETLGIAHDCVAAASAAVFASSDLALPATGRLPIQPGEILGTAHDRVAVPECLVGGFSARSAVAP